MWLLEGAPRILVSWAATEQSHAPEPAKRVLNGFFSVRRGPGDADVMWKIIHKVTTGLIIALGFVHLAFTAMEYASFSLDALWFLGSGLAIVYAGFLNVAVIRSTGDDRMVRVLGLIANLLLAGLFAATLSLMRPPQVFVGLALFVIAAVCVLARSRR